jgi:hypothetical protein
MLLGILSRTQGWESVLIWLFALALIASIICLAFSATVKLKRKH